MSLSGGVRTKLAIAKAAAESHPPYARNVAALQRVQPENLRHYRAPRAPWVPAADIEAFAAEGDGQPDPGVTHGRDLHPDGGNLPIRRHRRRHVGMGHAASKRRLAAARRAEQRHAADFRHRDRGRR